MKVIATKPPELYEGDILLRVYQNQSGPDHLFYFDLSKRTGLYLDIAVGSRFTSEHPQGIREIIKRILKENKDEDIVFQLSNEWDKSSHYWSWFETCFNKFEKEN